MVSSFPILRLPQLAIAEILNQLEIKQQVSFALCSKRAEMVFKSLRNKKLNPKIMVDDENDWIGVASNNDNIITESLFRLRRKYYLIYGRVEKVKIGGKIIDLWIEKGYSDLCLTITWENSMTKILSDFIFDLFGVRIHKINSPNEPQKQIYQ